jgi:ketosteroid isomerase-like protein
MPTDAEAVAARLRTVLESQDLAAYGDILAENVRWGPEGETPETCHSRAEVIARLTRQRAAGLQTRLLEIVTRDDMVLLGLMVKRANGAAREEAVYQILRVRDGEVVDIRGYPSRADAAERAGFAT